MYALFLALAFSTPQAEPAYFSIEVETNTEVIVSLKGQRLETGTTYRTESLTEKVCVELTVRYTDGGEVKTKTFWMDLEPGYKVTFTLTLYCNPPLVMEC
jgi:hypothetical protein